MQRSSAFKHCHFSASLLNTEEQTLNALVISKPTCPSTSLQDHAPCLKSSMINVTFSRYKRFENSEYWWSALVGSFRTKVENETRQNATKFKGHSHILPLRLSSLKYSRSEALSSAPFNSTVMECFFAHVLLAAVLWIQGKV